jgi:uncharacterized membrane protein
MRPLAFTSGLILRPSVALTAAWALAAVGWMLVVLVADQTAPPRAPLQIIDAHTFAVASGANAVLFALLLLELRGVLRAPVGLRRAQIAGHAGALVLLVALQVLALQAHGVVP